MTGLFMELGPCRVNKDGRSATTNEDSWIDAANMLFLDQPVILIQFLCFRYCADDSVDRRWILIL